MLGEHDKFAVSCTCMSLKDDDVPVRKAVVLPEVNAKSERWLGESSAFSMAGGPAGKQKS